MQGERKSFGLDVESGGLNGDDSIFAVQLNSFQNLENLRLGTTDAGVTKTVESIGSTLQKSSLAAGFITTGFATDVENDRLCRFIFDTSNTPIHRILCYSLSADFEYTVLLDSQITGGLGFTKQPIHSARVVNGILYWPDGTNNQPRRINISAGINLNHPGTYPLIDAYVSPLVQSDITWIRRQPAYPVTCVKATDAGYLNNFIKDEAFKVCYRYISREYETSTLSALSKLVNYNRASDTSNNFVITFPLNETITQDVLQIDLVVANMNSGVYSIVKSWNKKIAADLTAINNHNLGTPLTYTFYNDTTGIALDAAYSIKPYDSLPIYAQTAEFARNRAMLADNTVGLTSPTITSLDLGTTSSGDTGVIPPAQWVKISYNSGASTHYFLDFGSAGFFDITPQPTPLPYPSTAAYGTMTLVATGPGNFATYILANYPLWTGGIQYPGASATISGYSAPPPPLDGVVAFKSGTPYEAAVTFYDFAGRKCGIVKPVSSRITIPDRIYGASTFITGITWSLSNANALNEIPSFATSYSVDITKCLGTRYFQQLQGITCSYIRKDVNGNYLFDSTMTNTYNSTLAACAFDITTLFSVSEGYAFTDGDLVKIYIGANVYNLKILAQQGAWLITELQNLLTLDGTIPFLFQIYQPYHPSTSEPLYEVGKIYSISNAGTNTRTYSTIADVITGDVTLMNRNGVNRNRYQITAGRLLITGAYTIGCQFQSHDAADANYTTGNSPLQNLAGWSIGSDTTRAIITAVNQCTFRATGKVTIRVDKDTFGPDQTNVLINFGDSNSNYTTLAREDMSSGQTKTFFFDVTFTLAAGARLFLLGQVASDTSWGSIFYVSDLTISALNSAFPYITENMSPNDKFYKLWNTDHGRPNFIDTIGQVVRSQTIAWSNTFIVGAKANGASTFDALDTKDVPHEAKRIRKLQLTSKTEGETGSIMLAICEGETVSCYLGEVQLLGSSTTAFVAQSAGVIGTMNTLKGSFGTRNPESVVEHRGNVYWLDVDNGKYIQYSLNGLFPISNYRMTRFWKQFCDWYKAVSPAQIEAFGSRPYVFSTVDLHHSELLISIPKVLADPPKGYLPDYPSTIFPFDIFDGQAKTMVFKLDIGLGNPHWQGAFTMTPEALICIQNKLYSSFQGNLHLHNQTSSYNNFYGVSYRSRIMFVCNQDSDRVKIYENMNVQSNIVPSLVYLYSENPDTQASDLVDFDFARVEGIWYAHFYRNKLIPTAAGMDTTGLLTGNKMIAPALRVLIEWQVNKIPVELKYVQINYNQSVGHFKQF